MDPWGSPFRIPDDDPIRTIIQCLPLFPAEKMLSSPRTNKSTVSSGNSIAGKKVVNYRIMLRIATLCVNLLFWPCQEEGLGLLFLFFLVWALRWPNYHDIARPDLVWWLRRIFLKRPGASGFGTGAILPVKGASLLGTKI